MPFGGGRRNRRQLFAGLLRTSEIRRTAVVLRPLLRISARLLCSSSDGGGVMYDPLAAAIMRAKVTPRHIPIVQKEPEPIPVPVEIISPEELKERRRQATIELSKEFQGRLLPPKTYPPIYDI